MYYINVKTKTINEWTKKKRKNNEQKQQRKVSSKQNKQIRFTSTQTNKVYVNPSALSKRTIIIKGIYGYPLTDQKKPAKLLHFPSFQKTLSKQKHIRKTGN